VVLYQWVFGLTLTNMNEEKPQTRGGNINSCLGIEVYIPLKHKKDKGHLIAVIIFHLMSILKLV
jgi:hypothetical protein